MFELLCCVTMESRGKTTAAASPTIKTTTSANLEIIPIENERNRKKKEQLLHTI
jgi:uncharacterized GH25 family protein